MFEDSSKGFKVVNVSLVKQDHMWKQCGWQPLWLPLWSALCQCSKGKTGSPVLERSALLNPEFLGLYGQCFHRFLHHFEANPRQEWGPLLDGERRAQPIKNHHLTLQTSARAQYVLLQPQCLSNTRL